MSRLVIVSNRVASSRKANEGGLATAMAAAVSDRDVVWFGWSGNIRDNATGVPQIEREGRLSCMRIDLARHDYQGYYVGLSNRVLWPLFHSRINLAEFNREDWASYLGVNAFFAKHLADHLRPDDIVWIQDYHLIPLAQALRRCGVKNPLGFFLHTPFPSPSILTALPVHEDLVRSLFSYDLIGFQTASDLQAFHDYIERETEGWMASDGTAHAFGDKLNCASFPISVDTTLVAAQAARASKAKQAQQLRESLGPRHLVIGVDRLDYTKGLARRFSAVERLLSDYPAHRQDAVFLQIAPPTREDVPEYQQIRTEIDSYIGRLNGRFGEPDRLPVRYINRNFRQETLFAFYRASRVALVTPLRDGMNLVAKEYVASQDPDDPGVLILSQFAGSARELSQALIINPYDVDHVAEMIHRALTMPLKERRERHAAMHAHLLKHDIHAWRNSFLDRLLEAAELRGADLAQDKTEKQSFESIAACRHQ